VKQSTIHSRITVSLKTHILAPLPQKLFSLSLSLSLSLNLEGSPKKASTIADKDQTTNDLTQSPQTSNLEAQTIKNIIDQIDELINREEDT
jgi:hypothetical protein